MSPKKARRYDSILSAAIASYMEDRLVEEGNRARLYDGYNLQEEAALEEQRLGIEPPQRPSEEE